MILKIFICSISLSLCNREVLILFPNRNSRGYINNSLHFHWFHTCVGLVPAFLSFFLYKNGSMVHLGPSSGLYVHLTFSFCGFSSGVFTLRVFTNSLTLCHWISQNGNFCVSFDSASVALHSSSLGLSTLLVPPWPPLKKIINYIKIHQIPENFVG